MIPPACLAWLALTNKVTHSRDTILQPAPSVLPSIPCTLLSVLIIFVARTTATSDTRYLRHSVPAHRSLRQGVVATSITQPQSTFHSSPSASSLDFHLLESDAAYGDQARCGQATSAHASYPAPPQGYPLCADQRANSAHSENASGRSPELLRPRRLLRSCLGTRAQRRWRSGKEQERMWPFRTVLTATVHSSASPDNAIRSPIHNSPGRHLHSQRCPEEQLPHRWRGVRTRRLERAQASRRSEQVRGAKHERRS